MFPDLGTVTTIHPVARARALWSHLPSNLLTLLSPVYHLIDFYLLNASQLLPLFVVVIVITPAAINISLLHLLLGPSVDLPHWSSHICSASCTIFSILKPEGSFQNTFYLTSPAKPLQWLSLLSGTQAEILHVARVALLLLPLPHNPRSLLLCKPLPLGVSALVRTFSFLYSPCSFCHRALNVLLSSLCLLKLSSFRSQFHFHFLGEVFPDLLTIHMFTHWVPSVAVVIVAILYLFVWLFD